MNTNDAGRVYAAVVAAGVLAGGVAGCLPATTAAPAGTPTTAAVAGLRVAPEDTGLRYDREAWPHWSHQGRGCDTRESVLKTVGQNVETGKGCKVLAGRWVSAYDGVVVTDPGQLDLDHVVPLAEANRSGVRAWSEQQRERFANDPANLIPVTAKVNRARGDQDPGRWLPARDRCGFLSRYVAVKRAYQLTVDPAEAEALRSGLARCPGGGR
ncbi:HNH endonuclease family protein [Amycolatopsis suaedae]|uniref:HNH endonuclease n=1 Tax=Amycolatopsis suaedae TaxID=2510978 RepID=A0A4Q7J2S2_9PSEU|nr:HNH endonuclease family protein [Amycolatopsis suaedae]RZQ60866.1 HNH endonuclease [Amycolatopsis suaedae]